MSRLLAATLACGLVLGGLGVRLVRAGSTEPELAITVASASVDTGTVTLEIEGNFDYGNVVRLGYPLAVVVTEGATVGRLGLDGTVTVASGGGPALPVAGAPGVVAIAPTRITAVLPSALAGAGAAQLRLEASFDAQTLRSNTVEVQW